MNTTTATIGTRTAKTVITAFGKTETIDVVVAVGQIERGRWTFSIHDAINPGRVLARDSDGTYTKRQLPQVIRSTLAAGFMHEPGLGWCMNPDPKALASILG